MHSSQATVIGFIGVALLLVAFLLNLFRYVRAEGFSYSLLKFVGAALAWLLVRSSQQASIIAKLEQAVRVLSQPAQINHEPAAAAAQEPDIAARDFEPSMPPEVAAPAPAPRPPAPGDS